LRSASTERAPAGATFLCRNRAQYRLATAFQPEPGIWIDVDSAAT